MSDHTPWTLEPCTPSTHATVRAGDLEIVGAEGALPIAVAERIVTAVNSHDELLAACKALDEFQRVYQINTHDSAPGNTYYAALLMHVVMEARAALAKAEGR